jgi:hypothetical protein
MSPSLSFEVTFLLLSVYLLEHFLNLVLILNDLIYICPLELLLVDPIEFGPAADDVVNEEVDEMNDLYLYERDNS